MASVSEDLRTAIGNELVFTATRSSGPGGQNVNKVNTRAELRFNVLTSSSLSSRQKSLILERLRNKVNSEGEIIVRCQSERSQLRNRELAREKLFIMLEKALAVRKPRLKSGPTGRSVKERLESKRRRSAIKRLRAPGKEIQGE